MKKTILSLSAALSLSLCSAGVLTVSNNTALPGSPGQYTTIVSAISVAAIGDTILIQGSPIAYNESPSIVNKGLTFIGPGYNPQTSTGYMANINGTFNFGNGTSNSRLIGLVNVAVTLNSSTAISNILISRCSIYSSLSFYSNSSSVIVEDCIFSGYAPIYQYGSTNLIIRNNIFSGTYGIHGDNIHPDIIRNNLFLCSSYGIQNENNAVIENNIFYYTNSGHPITTVTNSTFNKNYVYFGDTLTHTFGAPYNDNNNIGTGNINSSSNNIYSGSSWDCFVNSSVFSYTANFRPGVSSLVHNAGTDLTDIGPTGGASPIYPYAAPYPLTGEPAVPQVQSITLPVSSVPSGGTLNITVKARKRN